MIGLVEFQVIESKHDDTPQAKVEALETQAVDAPIQEPTPGVDISSPRKRVSKHTKTSPSMGEKIGRRVIKNPLLVQPLKLLEFKKKKEQVLQ